MREREARGVKGKGRMKTRGEEAEGTWLYTVTASLASKASTKGLIGGERYSNKN